MGRITRAKATEIAEKMHIDEDAVLDLPNDIQETTKPATPEAEDRPPLTDLAPNSGSSVSSEDLDAEPQKPAKSKKGGKKGAKASKKNTSELADSTRTLSEERLEVIPDEIESVPSPASRAASDDLMKDEPEWVRAVEMSHLPVHDIRPKSPPSSAVRLTRSQLRKAPEAAEPKSLAEEKQVIAEAKDQTAEAALQFEVEGGAQTEVQTQDANAQPSQTAVHPPLDAEDMPNYLQTRSDPPMTPTKRQRGTTSSSSEVSDDKMSTSTDSPQTYDQLEEAAVQSQTPPRSTGKQSSSSDSITALDQLDDAVEKANAEVPDIQTSPEKPKSKKSAPVVRTTKSSQARISLAHGPKDAAKHPSWGRPRQSLAGLGQSTAKRITSASSAISNGDEPAIEKKETVIPHSKPRPISLSFPTPPPPPKSTKAPTQSNFQLPGEAIAAKLKAAKEARLAKEAEELEKRKAFKARPAPSITKTPTVRQTSTSKARESLMTGKPLASSSGVHKRANSVATTRPSTGPRPSSVKPTITKPAAPAKKSTAPSQTVSVTKRPATAMASLNKPLSRPTTANRPTTTNTTKPTARPSSVMARPTSTVPPNKSGTSKGKEVFNRAAQAKSTAEKEKREKEEAAKKARIEAAERGRQASREWAEKQKLKKMGKSAKENVDPVVVAGEGVEA
ncbi:hypothetical protein PRZ48_012493 [Zasmidium cellare]|uniref:Uncharacterized protein n=1 Tax=Zasmidium cellare TaxID=395010 RepID=A0ABR0E5Y0_ZASCE|nr:hypothetical protein PRZ48_012493 [Zasmidium cellare]